MATAPSYKTNVKRDATDSIRGYVYQIYQSVFAWLSLKEDELLFLECAEDFDVCLGQSVIGTQVKDLSSHLTLRSPDVVAALNNFWFLHQENPNHDVVLRFLTTAVAGYEKGAPFGDNQKGLEYWKKCQSNVELVEKLRSFLITLPLNSDLAKFVQTASVNDLVSDFINRIEWDLGSRDKEGLQLTIENKLKLHGSNYRISTHYSCRALPHLLKQVVDLLSQKGPKSLSYVDFLTVFDNATAESIPRNELEALRRNNSLQQLVDNTDTNETARLFTRAPVIESPLPIVDGAIHRSSLVEKLKQQLLSSKVLFLHGSSGVGKTNLAALLSEKIGGSCGWGGFRGRSAEQIRDMLSHAVREIDASILPTMLVLDDLDFNQMLCFERELIALIFTIVQSKGMVVVTSQKPPPLSIFPKLWISQECEQNVPYFDEQEICELIEMHGLHDLKKISQWQRIIYYSTHGHPQLVHARVRTLSNKGWSITSEDMTNPEEVERIKADARNRLIKEFPSEAARTLAYRLSIVVGLFRRNTAIAVAGSPSPIELPGEVFDTLVGPWVEKVGGNLYRISPLLTGAADSILPKEEINTVHVRIARSIINEESLNQYDVANAFLHAFLAKEKSILIGITKQIIQEKTKDLSYLCDPMFWFTGIALGKGQVVIDGNPSTELMLRLLQYKIIISSQQGSKILAIINKIEEVIENFAIEEEKQRSMVMAYSVILISIDVHIPSSTVVRLLSQLIDASKESELINIFTHPSKERYFINSNDPIAIFFSFQATRINGLDDLRELIVSLDALKVEKRNRLLKIFDVDISFSSLLVSQAWWKEVRNGSLDVQKTLVILQFVEGKAREWNAKELYKNCLSAISVIHDEYERSTNNALAVLDVAEKEFENDAVIVNQRAKVLFHAKRYSDALLCFRRSLLLPDLNKVDYVFACRDAGVISAKLNDWLESATFFQRGAEAAKQSKTQKNMGVGLIADAAISLWKAGKKKECLLFFADVLESLSSIETKNDIRAYHLHATVRHCIAWIHFKAKEYTESNLVEPYPGMCSNQEPHERIIEHRIIELDGAWGLLAATESCLALGDEIQKRISMTKKDNMPLSIAVYERVLALETLFREKAFDVLIPCLVQLHEAMNCTNLVQQNNIDVYENVRIPELPDGYWNDEAPWVLNTQIILAACTVLFEDEPELALRVNVWNSELQSIAKPTEDFKKFINVFQGGRPEDGNLYQQAASALMALSSTNLTPAQLWISSFRLLESIMLVKDIASKALEELLIKRWWIAVQQQRFAFITPNIAVAEIEKICLQAEYSGKAKVASVLLIAAPYLKIKLSSETRIMLQNTRDRGSDVGCQ